MPPEQLTRRALLRAGLLAGSGLLTAGCAQGLREVRLTVATGGAGGVYYALGMALADAWQRDLGLRQRPTVLRSAGSVANLSLLAAGKADVIFSTADVAGGAAGPPDRAPRALARVYDDAVQVVVPAESPITTVAQLRGHRVSVGAADSGVLVVANRLLDAAGLASDRDLAAVRLGIDDSVAALRDSRIDAFFWSGGLPTDGVAELAVVRPIRLLDLGPVVAGLRQRFPVYDVGTVPTAMYGIPNPVTTILVRNFLLVFAAMPDQLAAALVGALFKERELLVQANSAGRAIDQRSAIGTQPIALHPGAQRYYRDIKGG
ncbi:MAG: TAXI family TRAP transporter solute-binding subunit [Pseudonocardia sp.]